MFPQSIVVIVTKDHIVNLELDARGINEVVINHKFQMPNIDSLMELVARKWHKNRRDALSTSLDKLFAFGQFQLKEGVVKHCTFPIIAAGS